MFNYPSNSNLTNKVFKYMDIPVKTCSESNIENIKYNRNNIPINNVGYKSGWHTTWNNKKAYLRSSYEFDYAKQLDNQHIDYEVEKLKIEYYDTQRSMIRIAIPDFYIPETNTIVEIKSNYTLDIINMFDKQKAYMKLGYKFRLILEHKEYRGVEQLVARQAHNLEVVGSNPTPATNDNIAE